MSREERKNVEMPPSVNLEGGEKLPSSGDHQENSMVMKAPEIKNKNEKDEKKKGDAGAAKENLDEIFYEIEAIRKKRNHKGQTQYLIKWLNYPEKHNTWEPYENIKYCTELIEAFEQSSQGHKRKKKSILRKKKSSHRTQDDRDAATTLCRGEGNLQSPLLSKERGKSSDNGLALTIQNDSNVLSQKPENTYDTTEKDVLKDKKGKEKITDDEAVPANKICIRLPKLQQGVEEMNKNRGRNFVMQDYIQQWIQKEEAKGGVGAAAMSIFCPNCNVDTVGQDKVHQLLPTGSLPSFHFGAQGSKNCTRFTSAKKRKSGPMRRFLSLDELAEKATYLNLEDSTKPVAETVIADGIGTMAKVGLCITKILKPVHYSFFSSADSNRHACTTFMALRSDGIKVFVDDKELRARYPLLLIDFYEQNLHFTPDP